MVQPLFLERMAQRAHDVLLADETGEVSRPPLARKYLIAHALVNEAASQNPGTRRNRLWLLPSGPDQVHQTAMRGGPPFPHYAAAKHLPA